MEDLEAPPRAREPFAPAGGERQQARGFLSVHPRGGGEREVGRNVRFGEAWVE
jgi:hypothetical protein